MINIEAYLGIEHLSVRTEFLAMDSCNFVKWNPTMAMLHIELFIYVWTTYRIIHICVDMAKYRFSKIYIFFLIWIRLVRLILA